jgi:hypothetical protein
MGKFRIDTLKNPLENILIFHAPMLSKSDSNFQVVVGMNLKSTPHPTHTRTWNFSLPRIKHSSNEYKAANPKNNCSRVHGNKRSVQLLACPDHGVPILSHELRFPTEVLLQLKSVTVAPRLTCSELHSSCLLDPDPVHRVCLVAHKLC